MIAALLGFFGVLAVLLASIGLYGVISYMVARRINEFGVRLALGARRADVVGLVFKNSLLLAFAGVVIGLPVALGTGRLISTMLYGVTASDPWTLAGAALLMIVVAGLAGFLPAYRASRVDPMVALHYE
jgi:ABC-type antimicrobial peptide transport system permease subunit